MQCLSQTSAETVKDIMQTIIINYKLLFVAHPTSLTHLSMLFILAMLALQRSGINNILGWANVGRNHAYNLKLHSYDYILFAQHQGDIGGMNAKIHGRAR